MKFLWNLATLTQEVLKINNLFKVSVVKLHYLALVALKPKDAAAIYSRVVENKQEVDNLKLVCQHFFNAHCLLWGVNPTVWNLGYAIPYHTKKLHEKYGFGLGLNSMQGREAKHVRLAKYVENTCNVKKSLRWWIVFRHEFVCLLWLRELGPFSVSYWQDKRNTSESYVPNRVRDSDKRYYNCGLPQVSAEDDGCTICTSNITQLVKKVSRMEKSALNFSNCLEFNVEFVDVNLMSDQNPISHYTVSIHWQAVRW